MTYEALSYADLALAALLLLINGAVSIAFELGLARSLAIASVRMVVQLLLIGLILDFLLTTVSPFWTGLAVATMLGFAGYEAMARQDRKLKGFWGYGLGAGAMSFAALLMLGFALTTQVTADPWYHPRYLLPLLGMVLGNCMTGVALAIRAITMALVDGKAGVEAQLALGRSFRQAVLPMTRSALRTALTPTVNSMAATGLVYLPGMMTGQILAGIDPVEAVKYQLLVMFLIAGATAIGVTVVVFAVQRRLTDSHDRLRLDRLSAPKDR
ncbi:iron export ABC transporter permease subunit FetB [Nisaea acidiphila]|uniref:Iron export ABC transporter permease subunit FetB n=1 Tax=Nisaea acidiphila TaxID=1862145 RepID=A0A9J7AUI9_9PROT|nr:iron export ABC transporter permease subunit FetB [Nisaea acidiphila]UUX50782.1 iron export ABC transporter permease subunit FetB [Nisaea acidiphila]